MSDTHDDQNPRLGHGAGRGRAPLLAALSPAAPKAERPPHGRGCGVGVLGFSGLWH